MTHILKAVVGVIVLFVALIVVLKVLGFVSIIASLIFGFLLLAGLVWIIWKLFQLNPAAKSQSPNEVRYRLFSVAKTPVALFLQAPSMGDLISSELSANRTAFENEGKILEIDSDSRVQVLDDSRPEAVKIKVLEGQRQGASGWVVRSALVKSEERLSG